MLLLRLSRGMQNEEDTCTGFSWKNLLECDGLQYRRFRRVDNIKKENQAKALERSGVNSYRLGLGYLGCFELGDETYGSIKC
jgi:hypothetical protein